MPIILAKVFNLQKPSQSIVMKGSSLSAISEQRLREMDIFPVLFARASPADKLKIVKALQHSGEIVRSCFGISRDWRTATEFYSR